MGKITINAKTPVESFETTVTIDEEATAKELARKVAPEFGYNPEDAVIMFRGIELLPHQVLKEADIQDGFAVLVSPQALPRSITVNMKKALGGQQTSVRIEPDATIREVLQEAVSKLDLDITRITPMYNGNRLSLEHTLEDAGIEDDSTIVLTPQMEEPEPPQVVQPATPPPQIHAGTSTITPADEKLLREMLGMYKMKSDSLERKIQKNFLIPKKAAYILIVIIVISAILIGFWPYLTMS